jgi:hypothetical protein
MLRGYASYSGVALVAAYTPVSATNPTYGSFFKVVANDLLMEGSYVDIIEVKNPSLIGSTLRYSKIRIIPTNNGIIKRVIPIRVDPALDGISIGIKLLKVVGSKVANTAIKNVLTVASIAEILFDMADLYYENVDRALLEFDMSQLPWDGSPLYFVVEVSAAAGYGAGVSFAFNGSSTIQTSCSPDYPLTCTPW